MNRRKPSIGLATGDIVPVTLEPRDGYSDEDVIRELQRTGARHIELIAPGFVSANAGSAILHDIERIAFVHVNPEHVLHQL